MKDPEDARRQHATVDELLRRLYDDDPEKRREIQILADEVGMGKTFVALGVAYSVLAHLQREACPEDLRGCYRRVLVITPQNSALFKKWQREVAEFVRRCVHPRFRDTSERWFSPERVERLDDLALSLRRKGTGPAVMVITTGIFAGGKLVNYDLKRRFLLGVLFRYWGNKFRVDRRERLLKGAPSGWPKNPYEMIGGLTDEEWDSLPFDNEDVLYNAIAELDREEHDELYQLLQTCLDLSEPYIRDRSAKFKTVEKLLIDVYRRATEKMIRKAFPLIIVDEAHNWKNGPRGGANGYREFARFIAPNTRRALLLTATPFQLRPDEVLEILKVSDDLSPTPAQGTSGMRRDELKRCREEIIRPVLRNSAAASERFSKAWTKLSPTPTVSKEIEAAWCQPECDLARNALRRAARLSGVVEDSKIRQIADKAVQHLDPEIRKLLREALYLYAYNQDLSQELGAFVIRHRRATGHRFFLVGHECALQDEKLPHRPDTHLLHSAGGMDVTGPGELPHYILMRCVTEMKEGKGRSSLCADLTGCYSTLWSSAQGKGLKSLQDSPHGLKYLNLLRELVGEDQDPEHPKIIPIVNRVMNAWRRGEKSLIFCFRTNTAKRLREIIDGRIREELDARREKCMGGENALRALRGRLTGRESDLIPLGLDRVLWSFYCYPPNTTDPAPFEPTDLLLTDAELHDLAHLSLQYDVDISGDKVDRVFLHRATEHLLARRVLSQHVSKEWRMLLHPLADEQWIKMPYGVEKSDGTTAYTEEQSEETADRDKRGENAQYDERGVHSRYEKVYEPSYDVVQELARKLSDRRERARHQEQVPLLDQYAKGPNLWLGTDPQALNAPIGGTVGDIHRFLNSLTLTTDFYDWSARLLTLQALRRVLFRESVLLRLLPDKSEQDESTWGHLLVNAFHAPLPNQSESMADRISVFLEDIQAASGAIGDSGTARHGIYESTKLRDQQSVALVDGSTKSELRDRIFTGFNTPLLPEVLICTSVGQEGIDLHRHCRHVIHYDLTWNPAVLEQRTGRADRIGSKTFRERACAGGRGAFLEIGVPFLAGTYDERMYEELRIRAQTFEVLTGGDLAVENAEGTDSDQETTATVSDLDFVILPHAMIEELRVRLEV